MRPQHNAASVYHDLEKNIYYKIDKRTGREVRAHKNGMTLQTFKLDVSGIDYKKRRQEENLVKRLGINRNTVGSKLQPIQTISERNISLDGPLSHKSNSLQPNFKRVQSHISERMKSQESEANFLTSFHSYAEESFQAKQSSHINAILTNFSKINEVKIFENHCSVSKPAGTVIPQKIQMSQNGFRETQNIIYHPQQLKKKVNRPARATYDSNEQLRESWSRQANRQKKMFLEYNPSFKESDRSIKLLNDVLQKNKNIKKLEKMFLDEAQKTTNQIYT